MRYCPCCDGPPDGYPDHLEPDWGFCPWDGTPLLTEEEWIEQDMEERADLRMREELLETRRNDA